MRKIFLLLLFATNIINAQLTHPGISHKMSDLERMRAMVELGEEPWASEFKHLSSLNLASCDYAIKGDGRTELLKMRDFGSDGYAAYYNALMWFVTGDECHAEKCVEIFNSWTNLRRVPNSFALTNGRFVWKMCEGAEIIKHTYNGWSVKDQKAFGDMLVYPGWSGTTVPTEAIASRDVSFYWNLYQGDPTRYGNQGLFGFRSLMAMAIFLDNEVMYDRVTRYLQGLPHRSDDLPYPSGPPIANNKMPYNDCEYIEERVSAGLGDTIEDYGYNEVIGNYIWENGQCQEAARDQVHTGVGLHILSCIAEMAWNQGDDLYGHLDNRILTGFEYFARYGVGAEQYSEYGYPDWIPTVASGEFISKWDRSGRSLSKAINPHVVCDQERNSRGRYITNPIYEVLLGHYQDRMLLSKNECQWSLNGQKIFKSEEGIETIHAHNEAHNEVHGWGGLKFRRVSPGDPITGFNSDGTPIFETPVLPATIQAEHYDHFQLNGNGRTYYDTGVGNSKNHYRSDEDVDVRYLNNVDAAGGYVVSWIDDGEWLTYTVHIKNSGYYDFSVNYASTTGQNHISLYVSDELKVDEVNLPNQRGHSNFTKYLVSKDLFLKAGMHSIKIKLTGGSNSMHFDAFTFSNSSKNLALGKASRQSSTAFGGLASRANDGNTDGRYGSGSVTHTSHTDNPWWEVDLGKSYDIEQIKLFNRTDCCTSRLNNYNIYIYDNSRKLVDQITNQQTFTGSKIFNKKATGRYVRVQISGRATLSLAEVQVFGKEISTVLGNLALNRQTSQSSTTHGGVSSRAVDANTNGRYSQRSVTHTGSGGDQYPWWKVDLGAVYDLEQINIFNRTDGCCSNRLKRFRVQVLDANGKLIHSEYRHGSFSNSKSFDVSGIKGRYVKIELKSNTDPLSLAEVQVMGYGANIQSSANSTRTVNSTTLTILESIKDDTVQNENTVSLYPIPATDQLNIMDDVYTDAITKVTILDFTGVVVAMHTKGTLEHIDVSNLKTGMYFLTIQKASGNTIIKSFTKI